MPVFLRIPKMQLFITLLLIFATSFFKFEAQHIFYVMTTSVFFMVFFDLLFTFVLKRKLFFPSAALVTGTIVGLLIDPAAPWYQIALVGFLASVMKNLLRPGGKHVFNPAASGLFLASLLLRKPFVFWWGVSYQSLIPFSLENLIFFLVLLTPATVSAWRMKRYINVLSFFVLHNLIGVFQNVSLAGILNPSTVFFTLVMLPEPMTSPVDKKKQVFFGVFVALILEIFSRLPVPDPLLAALLLANLMFFKYRQN